MSQVVTKFPSTNQTIVAGWNNPANAYAEDGVNADASPPDEATEPDNGMTESCSRVMMGKSPLGWNVVKTPK